MASIPTTADSEDIPSGSYKAGKANLPEGVRRIAIRTDERIIFLRPEEIDWIEAAGNNVLFHVGEQAYSTRQTMSRLQLLLGSRFFVRVHRKAIVNLDRVVEYCLQNGNALVVLRNGARLPVSRSFRVHFSAVMLRCA